MTHLNGSGESHALRTSGRATRIEICTPQFTAGSLTVAAAVENVSQQVQHFVLAHHVD